MSPDEFRLRLEGLELPQSQAARLWGVDARQVRRWAAGDAPIPGTVAAWLRLAGAVLGGAGAAELEAQRAGARPRGRRGRAVA